MTTGVTGNIEGTNTSHAGGNTEVKKLEKIRDLIQANIKRLRKTIKDANILIPHFEQVLKEKVSTLYGLQHNTEQEEQMDGEAPCVADFAC